MTETAMNVEWPDHLDALIAAPDHHEILFESDRVRVPDGLRVADACLVPWPEGYVLRPGERREADVLIVPDAA